MPDLQTEIFTKVLPTLRHNEKETTMQSLDNLEFDDETDTSDTAVAQASQIDTTNVVTHRIVDYFVRQGSSDARTCAAALGLDRADISTRITQLMKRGYIVKLSKRSLDSYTVYQWAGKPYSVVTREEAMRRAIAARHVNRHKAASKPTSKAVHTALAKARAAKAAKKNSVPTTAPITGQININELPLSVARDLYDQLRKVFGG